MNQWSLLIQFDNYDPWSGFDPRVNPEVQLKNKKVYWILVPLLEYYCRWPPVCSENKIDLAYARSLLCPLNKSMENRKQIGKTKLTMLRCFSSTNVVGDWARKLLLLLHWSTLEPHGLETNFYSVLSRFTTRLHKLKLTHQNLWNIKGAHRWGRSKPWSRTAASSNKKNRQLPPPPMPPPETRGRAPRAWAPAIPILHAKGRRTSAASPADEGANRSCREFAVGTLNRPRIPDHLAANSRFSLTVATLRAR